MRLHIGLLLAKVSSLTDLGSVTFCTQTALNPRSTRYEVGNGSYRLSVFSAILAYFSMAACDNHSGNPLDWKMAFMES